MPMTAADIAAQIMPRVLASARERLGLIKYMALEPFLPALVADVIAIEVDVVRPTMLPLLPFATEGLALVGKDKLSDSDRATITDLFGLIRA